MAPDPGKIQPGALKKGVAAFKIAGDSGPAPIYIKVHSPSISIWYGDREGYTFDPSGRPFAAFFRQRRFRRALDGKLIETRWGEGPPRMRPRYVRVCSGDEKQNILQLWRKRILPVSNAVQKQNIHPLPLSHPAHIRLDLADLRAIFATLLSWDDERLKQDVAEYHKVYYPVTILPPDQYLALYLQMTIGCAYNRCVFCNFYRDRPYVVRSPEAFQAHLDRVERYFGEAIYMRRTLFLGDANALHIDEEELRKRFEILAQRFAIGPGKTANRPQFEGIYSFLDSFSGVRLSSALLKDLARVGLRRVYIGLETGHEPLRRFLQKPGSTSQVIEVVQNFKAAGIQVGIIILVGIGGKQLAPGHLQDSLAALRQMPLDRGDIIYLSDLVVQQDTEYGTVARQAGWEMLHEKDILEQRQGWVNAIRRESALSKVKLANYDIREFVY